MTVLGFGWYNYAKLQPSSSPSLASSSAALAAAGSPAPRVEEYRPLAGDEKQLRSGDDDGIIDADDDDDKDKDKGNGSDSESDVLGFPEFPELLATLPQACPDLFDRLEFNALDSRSPFWNFRSFVS